MSFLIVLFFMLIITSVFHKESVINNNYIGFLLISGFLLILSVDVINRDQTHDTLNYIISFEYSIGASLSDLLINSPYDFGWTLIQFLFAQISESSYFFLVFLWLLFIFGLLFFLNGFFNVWQTSVIIFSYSMYLFFYSYTHMAIRQGLAMIVLLIAIKMIVSNNRRWKVVVLLICASLLHWSAIPFAIASIFVKLFYRYFRTLFALWLVSLVVYFFNINKLLFSGLITLAPKYNLYSTTPDSVYYEQNTLGFALFSGFCVFLLIALKKYYFKDTIFEFFVSLFVVFNAIFLLLGFISYADRIASYSWFMLPFLVWYPFFKRPNSNGLHITLVLLLFLIQGILTGAIYHYDIFYIT